MDALELLRNDHDTVRSLFKEFESAKDSEDVERMSTLQQEIFRELELHATIEEEIFYPAARAFDGEAEELMLEGVEEHHVVETLIEEIKQLSPSDEEWAAKMTVLIENVEHHAQEEEEELFPKYREALGERKLAEMGKELEEAKQRLASGGQATDDMSKQELYEKAQEQDIPGRSQMTKDELKEALGNDAG